MLEILAGILNKDFLEFVQTEIFFKDFQLGQIWVAFHRKSNKHICNTKTKFQILGLKYGSARTSQSKGHQPIFNRQISGMENFCPMVKVRQSCKQLRTGSYNRKCCATLILGCVTNVTYNDLYYNDIYYYITESEQIEQMVSTQTTLDRDLQYFMDKFDLL